MSAARKSPVRKRSIMLDGHKTSVTLEDAFWDAFKEIATAQGTPASRLIATLDSERRERVLEYYRSRCSPDAAQHKPQTDRQTADSRD
jgi:predicted DNA-binding ribbon-helix-helix protein